LISAVALRDRGVQDRLEWWAQGLVLVLAHPLLGAGVSNFPVAIVPYLRRVEGTLNKAFWVEHPHNESLGVVFEGGALGLGAALWLTVRAGRLVGAGLRWRRPEGFLLPAVAAGLVGAAANSAFFYLFHDPTGLVVVLTLLALLGRLVALRPAPTRAGAGSGLAGPTRDSAAAGLASFQESLRLNRVYISARNNLACPLPGPVRRAL
jgi:O-antigen ligase